MNNNSSTPTTEAYGEFQMAYDHFNEVLFENKLPPCLITLHRESKRTRGYFSNNRFISLLDDEIKTDEIAMNPLHFASRTITEVLSTLAHEMVHLWQAHHGKPSRRSYHNKEWGQKMKEVGLYPSNTGEPGGKETGQQMTHYIVKNGPFYAAAESLLKNGFTLSWADVQSIAEGTQASPTEPTVKTKSGNRLKYTCLQCQSNAWGKADLKLVCGDCMEMMQPDEIDKVDGGNEQEKIKVI